MRTMDIPAAMQKPAAYSRGVRPLFVAAILTGSFLLFLVQPMIARMALPRLGGAPAVWNSAMLVYQALLLGGYAYSHALGRLAPRRQGVVHLAVLALAACTLPIGLNAMTLPADAAPELWVPWLLLLSIGPLFFAVSAQAPLLQRWFALRAPGANPYALYAASNLGSFGGLLAYPLIVEPLLGVATQSRLWSAGYALLFLLVLACALRLPPARTISPEATPAAPSPPLRAWLRWIALAAIPSGLMLSTTTHLTTDIVAMPLIWVVPLGLYLLSFTIAFSDRGRAAALIAQPLPILLIVGAEIAFAGGGMNPLFSGGVDLALLFVIAVALHREMYRTRPDASQLTAFYLAMSIGGVLGGLFCALLAPAVFNWVYEHPILIAAAALMAPLRPFSPRIAALQTTPGFGRWAMGLAALLAIGTSGLILGLPPLWLTLAVVAVLALLAFVSAGRALPFAAAIAALMLASGGWFTLGQSAAAGERIRSYFGVYTIRDTGGARLLIHGTTTHGIQRREPGREREATSYYAPLSGVGLAMAQAGPRARIGVVGLGAGTLACYRRPGQDWRFYEIDPAVAAIARDPARFTFLSRCAPDVPVVIGDARLSLSTAPAGGLDLLVIDAFSSDAVPMHLLTREAFAVYARDLTPAGLLMVHISNRFFDLEPVLAAAARADGLHAALRDYTPDAAAFKAGAARSTWVALSRDPASLERLAKSAPGGWRPLAPRPGFTAWSDEYATVLPLLKGI